MAISTRFSPGQTDYIEQLNLLQDSFDGIVLTGGGGEFTSTVFALRDATDTTKVAKFSASTITTGTTRTYTLPDSSGTFSLVGRAETVTGVKTFDVGNLKLNGSTSGAITFAAPAVAGSGTVTFPATGSLAVLDSPAFTNNPTAPTQAAGNNSTRLATTAFVATAGNDKLLFGDGVPSSGLGIDGQRYVRTDKPFIGAVYKKTSGAWAMEDNSYTLAGLPTAGATYVGAVATIVDSTYCPTGKDVVCVTYNGGTNYYWVPTDRRWTVLKTHDKDTAANTAGVSTTYHTFVLPNRADIYVPGMDIYVMQQILCVGQTVTKSADVFASALSSSGNNKQFLIQSNLTTTQQSATGKNSIHVTASNAGYSHPFSAQDLGFSGLVSDYSGTWAGLSLAFRKQAASGTDTVQGASREITFIYP